MHAHIDAYIHAYMHACIHAYMHTFIPAYRHTCRLLLPHHACTARHRKIAQDALDSTTLPQKLGAYMLVAWAKQNGHAAVKETGPTISRAGFKGLHWAWMAIAAVQHLRDAPTSCHARVRESKDPAQWFAYYVSFLAHFPWGDVALMPDNEEAPRAMRCNLQVEHEELKENEAVLVLVCSQLVFWSF